ncbi:Mpp10 protein [Coprinopsis marcescibilis]|uniref:U3 small nucleolar ribonucleoprotein protein MPP10 n=1 Tax=Coprinopsis marcescibilis TaxID=230819 RepID=A0A5C3LDD5_COPMA|nr:Mpp10 protein [Coprinopsis marcescibilis]
MSFASETALSDLTRHLENTAEFALGSEAITDAALKAAKTVFDASLRSEPDSIKHVNDLFASLTPLRAPKTRSQSQSKSAKQPQSAHTTFRATPLASLFVDGLEEEQVWAQLDLRTQHLCELLDVVLEGELVSQDSGDEDEDFRKSLQTAGFSIDDSDSEEDSGSEDEDSHSDEDSSQDDVAIDGGDDSMDDVNGFEETLGEDEDEGSEDRDEGPQYETLREEVAPTISQFRKRKRGASQVDDDFFDLTAFNSEVDKAEAKRSTRGHLAAEDESDDESDLDSVDLFAPVGDDIEAEEEDDDNTKELFYADFFEPPQKAGPSKATGKVRFHEEVRVKKIQPSAKKNVVRKKQRDNTELKTNSLEEDEESDVGSLSEGDSSSSEQGNVRSTIERLKDDLFADEDGEEPQTDMSTHQKRLATLQQQISEFETENVSRKDWTLMGEADTRSRPQNSLLEEDLEFERAMKSAPVITEEKVQSLEDVIKARILEDRFDDVVRLRPVDDKAFLPSRILELQDTKSTQSLAQIYENEYMAGDESGKTDDRDGKLKKEHEELDALWDKISEKLDALSNAYFVPKQPKSIISTVSDVSATTMESALPTAKSANSMLAPEEIFSAETSHIRSKSELTPLEKRALRTKERKLKKKQRSLLDNTIDKVAKARSIGGVKKQKQAALEKIVKSGKGVTVVGKSAKDLKTKKRHKSS